MCLIYNGTDKKIKVKFETSATTQIKVAFKMSYVPESTMKALAYPKTGSDTLVFNQLKEITLDSIPEAKYTLSCTCNKKEYTLGFNVRKKKYDFACEVCGRDLTLTLDKLQSVLNNKTVTDDDLKLL